MELRILYADRLADLEYEYRRRVEAEAKMERVLRVLEQHDMSDLDNGKRGGRMFVLALTGQTTEAEIVQRVNKLANFYRDKGQFDWATGFVGGATMTLDGTYSTSGRKV